MSKTLSGKKKSSARMKKEKEERKRKGRGHHKPRRINIHGVPVPMETRIRKE